MIVGLFIGILYCRFMYRKQGENPYLNINYKFGPLELKNGMIFYNNFHIHHWMIGLFMLPFTQYFKYNQTKWFFMTLTLHGLSYSDRFDVN
jgi:hypothetical protein